LPDLSRTAWTIEHPTPQLLSEYHHTEIGQASMVGAYLKILFILLHRSLEPTLSTASQQDDRIAIHEQFMELLESHYLEHWAICDFNYWGDIDVCVFVWILGQARYYSVIRLYNRWCGNASDSIDDLVF